jgi:hypothetical protein
MSDGQRLPAQQTPAFERPRTPPPRPERGGISATEAIVALLSLIWVVGLTLIFVFGRTDAAAARGFDVLGFVMTLLAIFVPVAVLWVGVAASRGARTMREESARLQAAIDGMRQTYLSQMHGPGGRPVFEKKLDEIAQAQRKTEMAIATFASIRNPALAEPRRPPLLAAPAAAGGDQASLELGAEPETAVAPVSTEEFILALNFPETAEDVEGFRALRRALTDRPTAQLIQASQDVLTLLSQDGIYMDDLSPDRAKPDVWRRFAQGERGRTISALGGVRDRSSLALSAARTRSDTIFRDAVHHFLRKFDHMLAGFEKRASDAEIADLSDTRTARAFMLLGRVAGTFD